MAAPSTLRAIIFDFDGTIVDSEAADVAVWRESYAEVGLAFPLERWVDLIGRAVPEGGGFFDAYAELEQRTGQARSSLRERRHRRILEIVHAGPTRPGVMRLVEQAGDEGLALAVASSATLDWVQQHLDARGLTPRFAAVVTADQVGFRGKPEPDVFLEALRRLDVRAAEAIAIEDSPHGVAAARAAGLYTVLVPNDITRGLSFAEADLTLESLEDIDLPGLRAALAARTPVARQSIPGQELEESEARLER